MAFFNLVFPESDTVVRHTFDNRKAFDADALLSQLVPAFLEALFDGNRAPDKSRTRLPDQCDKPAQRLSVSKKSSTISTRSEEFRNSFSTIIVFTLPWV